MDLSKFKLFSIFKVRKQIREIENKEQVESIEQKLSLMGFKISQIDISVTVPPKTAISIDLVHSKIDQDVKKELLEISGFFFKTIIYALDKAIDMQKSISFEDKYLAIITLELSVIPTIKLSYKPKETI